jgi:para-nitrobenzyl esterase
MARAKRGALVCLAAALVLAPSVVAIPQAAATGLVVHTRDGNVRGVDTPSGKEWRGIPYAAPPLGELRWHPPAPAAPWAGVRDTTEFRPPCLQLTFDENDPSGTTGREDCLYLNVFVPPTAEPDSGLAVMVHLHPGGNYFGAPYEDASAFVARGVIIVTVAYPLGIFGFLGRQELLAADGTTGEYAMLDQLAALRWVHENIAAFGGDPERVTLFGSSAGSFDTVALMASPLSDGLIARAAVQGEPFWGLTGIGSRVHTAERIGHHAARVGGCLASTDVVACLRAMPARLLVRNEGPGDIEPLVGGVVLPRSPLRLLSEASSTVPLLVGFDREEDRYFVLGYPIPERYTRQDWLRDTTDLVGAEHAAEERALYPRSSYDSRAWAFVTMATDDKRGCPTRRLAGATSGPVWRYLYTHTYENDPGLADGRAAHIFEEPFLWGDFNLFDFGHMPTPAEKRLSDRMTDYWTNFAKTGDPNGPTVPTWPSYDATTEPTLTLDDNVGVVHSYHAEQCALLDTLRPYPPPAASIAALDPLGTVTR